MQAIYDVLTIGYGHMARPMFQDVDANTHIRALYIIRNQPQAPSLEKAHLLGGMQGAVSAIETADIRQPVLLLAVRPEVLLTADFQQHWQQLYKALQKKSGQKNILVITIASKRDHAFYTEQLGIAPENLVRFMPNLPIAIGKGASLVFAPALATRPEKMQILHQLFGSRTELIACDSEAEFMQLTPVTGCMPGFLAAYADYMAQQSTKAAKAVIEDLSSGGALQTLSAAVYQAVCDSCGAQAMTATAVTALLKNTLAFATLRLKQGATLPEMVSEVATKGGLTEAGVLAMRAVKTGDVTAMFTAAIKAAQEKDQMPLRAA